MKKLLVLILICVTSAGVFALTTPDIHLPLEDNAATNLYQMGPVDGDGDYGVHDGILVDRGARLAGEEPGIGLRWLDGSEADINLALQLVLNGETAQAFDGRGNDWSNLENGWQSGGDGRGIIIPTSKKYYTGSDALKYDVVGLEPNSIAGNYFADANGSISMSIWFKGTYDSGIRNNGRLISWVSEKEMGMGHKSEGGQTMFKTRGLQEDDYRHDTSLWGQANKDFDSRTWHNLTMVVEMQQPAAGQRHKKIYLDGKCIAVDSRNYQSEWDGYLRWNSNDTTMRALYMYPISIGCRPDDNMAERMQIPEGGSMATETVTWDDIVAGRFDRDKNGVGDSDNAARVDDGGLSDWAKVPMDDVQIWLNYALTDAEVAEICPPTTRTSPNYVLKANSGDGAANPVVNAITNYRANVTYPVGFGDLDYATESITWDAALNAVSYNVNIGQEEDASDPLNTVVIWDAQVVNTTATSAPFADFTEITLLEDVSYIVRVDAVTPSGVQVGDLVDFADSLAPLFTLQPVTAVDAQATGAGTSVTFTAAATDPFTGGAAAYEWYVNGVATGVTTDTYTINNLTADDQGSEVICQATANGISVNSDPGYVKVIGLIAYYNFDLYDNVTDPNLYTHTQDNGPAGANLIAYNDPVPDTLSLGEEFPGVGVGGMAWYDAEGEPSYITPHPLGGTNALYSYEWGTCLRVDGPIGNELFDNKEMSVSFWKLGWSQGTTMAFYGENGKGWQLRKDGDNKELRFTRRVPGVSEDYDFYIDGTLDAGSEWGWFDLFLTDRDYNLPVAGYDDGVTNGWHHIVLVQGGNKMQVWLDGVNIVDEPGQSGFIGRDDKSHFTIAGRDNQGILEDFNTQRIGYDEVRVYNYELEADQIDSLYTSNDDAGDCVSPVGDLSGDCKVGVEDLAIMALNWLTDTN